MTHQLDVVAANKALAKVARRGLRHVDVGSVRTTALAVWYGRGSLDLDHATGPHRGDAVSLVERLSYYNVVPQERKRYLLQEVRRLRADAGMNETPADEFGRAFLQFLPDLQPLQTRHYAEGMKA
ncbi:hypothetical protein GALL_375710 [mine drainage metagenome]|uniref:Uncharacterized protein n=1 Tax=mine drainage metagenome TaxID=410659 RepID=A0A1J5QBU7_9ZZZZ